MLKFRFQATTRKPDGQLDKPYLNGAIPRLGRLLGVTTPVNDAVVGIIRARERRMLASMVTQ